MSKKRPQQSMGFMVAKSAAASALSPPPARSGAPGAEPPIASEWLNKCALAQVRDKVKKSVGSVKLTTEADIFNVFKL